MRNIVILSALLVLLCSCAAGPVYIAKDEPGALKETYDDERTQRLYNRNDALFKNIYQRYQSAKIGFYEDGVGITTLRDQKKEKLHYLMVFVRPSALFFDVNSSKPNERYSRVMNEFPKYMKFMKSSDLERDDIEGLAFGIYWPVRDYSQCNQYGGFLEYIQVYFPKEEAKDVLEGKKDFRDALAFSEVIVSLELKPAQNVRPVF